MTLGSPGHARDRLIGTRLPAALHLFEAGLQFAQFGRFLSLRVLEDLLLARDQRDAFALESIPAGHWFLRDAGADWRSVRKVRFPACCMRGPRALQDVFGHAKARRDVETGGFAGQADVKLISRLELCSSNPIEALSTVLVFAP